MLLERWQSTNSTQKRSFEQLFEAKASKLPGTPCRVAMALWRVLSDADRSATVALDMLLFLKRAPPVVCAQWTHFLQEIDNKCADLQIPFEHFHKTAQSMVKGKMSDELLPIGPARDEQQEAASSGDTDATDAQVAARVNWIELCFFLAVQVQHATAASAIDSTTGFPVVLSKKQRELWKKKKVALILDVFASKLGDEQQVCYDGLREMKNGQGKWVFLCDLFLSELREIQIERWLRRKIKIEASSTTPPHVQDGVSIEDVGALLQLLAKTSLSTGTTSSLKSSSFTETELVAAMNEATQRVLEFSNPMLAIQSPIDEEQNVSIRSDDTETSGSDPGFPRKIELQVDEVEKLQIISFILRANYQTRKEQLLECSDVTLGSFESFTKLKNDASAGEAVEDELTTECAKPTSSPVDINVEQLVLATASEASQRAKLSADGSSVHNLLIGPVHNVVHLQYT